MTIDELLQKHPLPWRASHIIGGRYDSEDVIVDDDGTPVAYPHDDNGTPLCGLASGFAALRAQVAHKDAMIAEQERELLELRVRVDAQSRALAGAHSAAVFARMERLESRNAELEENARELRLNALPSNCTHCNGSGAEPPGCPESDACERCGGWTSHKRLLRDECSVLRARNAELEAYVVRMKDAPKRLADALERECYMPSHAPIIRLTAHDIRTGLMDAAIYGDGGCL